MAKKWRCTVCGYIHEGPEAPDQCPMCKVGKEKFVEVEEKAGGLDFVTEHKLGDGKGASQELWEGLNNHFMGECSEVGQYLAMARQADREGYPEIAEAFKRYAWEEAEHASKFAELIGDIVWDTKTNLFKRMNAECGACEDKMRLARLAKEQNLAAVHDTVGILALGADLKLEDRVVGLDKFRFNVIIGGKKILLVQFRRLLGGCELFHESAPLTLLLSYPTTVRR